MVLKCSKTNRLFFDADEAKDHAEALGKAYANFDEVSLDSKVFFCTENGRFCFTQDEVVKIQQRDPGSKTFEEQTVQFLADQHKEKMRIQGKKERFYSSVNQKKFDILTQVKGVGLHRAAKALHFTKSEGTVEAAEKWIEENAGDPSIDTLTLEFIEEQLGSAPEDDVEMEDAADFSAPDERKPGDPNPIEIKEKVNQQFVKEIVDMGFSEMQAEKALYKVDNASVEHAVNWLGEHSGDADFDLPLKKPAPVAPPKPKMSKEEAEAKARELQKKIRERKAQEEKLSEKEKERMRIESTKMMLEANEKLKEEERKRDIELQLRQKAEAEKDRLALKEKLRQDYIERFGCEPPPEESVEKTIKEKSGKDQIVHFLNKLKKGLES